MISTSIPPIPRLSKPSADTSFDAPSLFKDFTTTPTANSLAWQVDPQERSLERIDLTDGFVDSSRLPHHVRIHCSDDDARVPGTRRVQRDELPTVECKDCSIALHRELQNLLVGDRSICLSGFLRC